MQRFPIIPLAPNAGLIGWAQGTDTFHVLVRDYREARNILLNIENRLMVQVCCTLNDASMQSHPAIDGQRLQDPHVASEGRGLSACHGQHNWSGSLPRHVVAQRKFRELARAKNDVHSFVGGVKHGRLRPWPRRPASLEHPHRSRLGQGDTHRLWRLLRDRYASRRVPREGSLQADKDADPRNGGMSVHSVQLNSH